MRNHIHRRLGNAGENIKRKNKRMIKAILFDLDNTLINFTEFKKRATEAAADAMSEAGLKTEPEELKKKLLRFYYSHGIESDDAYKEYLKKEFGSVDYRILAVGVNAYLKEKYKRLEPYPNTQETLGKLKEKKYKLGVVSDGLRLKAWMRLNEAKLDEFFDVVVTFDDTGRMKPDSKPFLKATQELKVSPGECLFLGDWPEKDMAGAKAVGMLTCFARYGHQGGEKTPDADYEIDDIQELLKIIKT